MSNLSSLWLVTREYAGIAEAGGVKNVACSLAEGLVRKGLAVKVFIPRYGCVRQEGLPAGIIRITIMDKVYEVTFSRFELHGVVIILVGSRIFSEKKAVYTYTDAEEHSITGASRGKGHFDTDSMNVLLQKAVIEWALMTQEVPDIIHCQDAHTAILPALIRCNAQIASFFSRTACVVTIHNAGPGYRQSIPSLARASYLTGLDESCLARSLLNGNVEPFLLSEQYGNVTTVSPWYANELTSSAYNALTEGLSGEFEKRKTVITGIINGIDYHRYEPSDTTRSLLPFSFDPIRDDFAGKYACRDYFIDWVSRSLETPHLTCFGTLEDDPHAVYFSYHGRIVWQKGLDVFEETARIVLDHVPTARFVILGQGDPVLEGLLARTSMRYPGRFVFIRGYERTLARLAVAISDFIVLPSMFEPCGLEDYIAQIFATIPVAHAVGGLQKIIAGENGFVYRSDQHGSQESQVSVLAPLLIELAQPVVESSGRGCASVSTYRKMMSFGSRYVRDVCNWDTILESAYVPYYRRLLDSDLL